MRKGGIGGGKSGGDDTSACPRIEDELYTCSIRMIYKAEKILYIIICLVYT